MEKIDESMYRVTLQQRDTAFAELAALRAEVERLREALRSLIVEAEGLLTGAGIRQDFLARNRTIIDARSALAGKGE